MTPDVRSERRDVFVRLNSWLNLAELRKATDVFCIQSWPLLHSSNHVPPCFDPYAFSQPHYALISIDAFVHITKPYLILLLSYDCSYLTVILNWGLPNQKSLFWPCESMKTTSSVRDSL